MKNETNLNEITRGLLKFEETIFNFKKNDGIPNQRLLIIETDINNGLLLKAKIEMNLKFDFDEVIFQVKNISIKNKETFNHKIDSVIDYFNRNKNEFPKIMAHLSEFNNTDINYSGFGSFIYENRKKLSGTKYGI